MEFIFDFILEFIFDFIFELAFENSVPKYIRYPLLVIITLFFIAVIGVLFFAGISFSKENILIGIFFILVGLFLLIMSIIKLRKTYFTKTKKK